MTSYDSMFVYMCPKSPKKNLGSMSQPSPILAVGGFSHFSQISQTANRTGLTPRAQIFWRETLGTSTQTYYHMKSFGQVHLGILDMGFFFELLQ